MNEAKQKAKELVDKLYKNLTKNYADNDLAQILANKMWYKEAKQCALIACDEIINQFNEGSNNLWASGKIDYWQSVKQEITKL